ncbi:MAG: hypothetical protein K0M55_13170 [Rhizobium sp.]|nr:hypothetical protein [Rhizobium sp.]MBW8321847.1 hypothetical protein [Rhizobium sp.]MBW8444659.1 hypothetical protein [Arenimonas sp.]
MKQFVFQEKYPVFQLEIDKSETDMKSVDDIIQNLKAKIDAHPMVSFIAIFDHYAHTKAIGGEIAPDIRDAKNLVFCFGVKLPNPEVMAVRPRSIGVTEFEDKFVVNFLEPPMPVATEAMEAWVKGLRRG